MEFSEYQSAAKETAIYPPHGLQVYPLLGLVGEVGEFANKYKKVIRDGAVFHTDDVKAELGDILWYVSAIATDFGLDLGDVAESNIRKLLDRKNRGVLGGSGDNR